MGIYVGVNGAKREVREIYIGVNGQPRRVTEGYVGVNGKPRLFYSGGTGLLNPGLYISMSSADPYNYIVTIYADSPGTIHWRWDGIQSPYGPESGQMSLAIQFVLYRGELLEGTLYADIDAAGRYASGSIFQEIYYQAPGY